MRLRRADLRRSPPRSSGLPFLCPWFCSISWQAGSRPGGRVTFFASPKKVTQERRPRCLRPLCACRHTEATCGARAAGGSAQTRPCGAQTVALPDPRIPALLGAFTGEGGGRAIPPPSRGSAANGSLRLPRIVLRGVCAKASTGSVRTDVGAPVIPVRPEPVEGPAHVSARQPPTNTDTAAGRVDPQAPVAAPRSAAAGGSRQRGFAHFAQQSYANTIRKRDCLRPAGPSSSASPPGASTAGCPGAPTGAQGTRTVGSPLACA